MIKAFYVSGNRNLPETVGLVPLSRVTYIGLTGDKVYGFRPFFDAEKPSVYFKQIFARWAAYWRRPSRFGGGSEDGNTAELIKALQDALSRQLPAQPQEPLTLFAQMGEGWRFNWSDKTVSQLVMGIGPGKKGVTPLQPLSPGGQIEAVESDDKHVYVSFGQNGVVELPVSTRLYPWAVEGAELEEGVPLGDFVPRDEYTVSQFNTFPNDVKEAIAHSAVRASSYVYNNKVVTPVSMVCPEDRPGILHGGRVKSLYAWLEARKLYVTNSDNVYTEYGVAKLS